MFKLVYIYALYPQGKGEFSMEFKKYSQASGQTQAEMIAAFGSGSNTPARKGKR